ncbi:DUF6377 domain-containing protein [Pseudochryseolinea flava]|uniref:Tetratricopeptide repeat protein n=1 Tax=Pseudochryseolinea flava TaxID=2059302 RepID=A0A364XY23_9BACT|nr:DUF6377 domain-containing protein [Pseudochryseolinea flava]RAV99164.1 tetratricopeptide repeat protein [Pseudochryseolinea flava]
MKYSFLMIFVLYAATAIGQNADSLLRELDKTIAQREQIHQAKLARIEKLRSNVKSLKGEGLFEQYVSIYEEYKSFLYDSAFSYAQKLHVLAVASGDPLKIEIARMKLGFVLVSSGLFKEAIDTLMQVRSTKLPARERFDYLYLMARACYDLADFNRDAYYAPKYATQGNAFIDSAMLLMPENSRDFLQIKGLKHLHLRDMPTARSLFEKMIHDFDLEDHDFAVAASTLSFIYLYTNNKALSKEMLIRAAIADIRSSTKETLATIHLADLLYQEGNIEKAYEYVKISMEDANFYGARHRKIQVAAIYPIIEGQQLGLVESKRKILMVYAWGITLLSVLIIGFGFIFYKQFQKLQVAKGIISKANDSLTETNHQLGDANKIKEEYLWYYFNTTADSISKLDSLKKSLELKLTMKKLDDVKFTVDSINIRKERDDLYHNFDKIFLKLFPDFVQVFNSFFNPEDQIVLKEGQLMNTELRIFALVRLGINDNEKIAKILDYSVTTIYTYKTRLRNKSILPNDTFDKQIMTIRAI